MKIASVNTLTSMLPWTSASMATFSVPPISLLAALGLLALLAYRSWLSYEEERVCIRVNFSCSRLSSFRSIRNFVVWKLRRVAHVLGHGMQNGPGVLIFCSKRFGTARIVRYASGSTRCWSCLTRLTSKDSVGNSIHLPQAKLTYSQWALATLGRRLQTTSRQFSTHNTKVLRSNQSERKANIS